MTNLQLPPTRDLPPGRLDARRQHLLQEIAEPPSRREGLFTWMPSPRRAVIAGAAVAVVVLAAVVALTTTWGTDNASAAQARASLVNGLSTPRDIGGEFTVESRPAQPKVGHTVGCQNCKPPLPSPSVFFLGKDGSYSTRPSGTSGSAASSAPSVAYDAATDTMTSTYTFDSTPFYVRTTGNNPALTTFRPEQELATWVLHALDSGDPNVTSTTFEGRNAWALTIRFQPGGDYYDTYGARVDVIVDKETGLLLKLTQYENDPNYWTSIETIKNLTLDQPAPSGTFTLAVPANAKVINHDQGYRPVARAAAKAITGYPPLLPADTGGRALTALAAAKKAELSPFPNVPGPVFRDALTAIYGNDLAAITVMSRRGKPLDAVPQITAHTVTLTGGSMRGTRAYVSDAPTTPGYLSLYRNGLVVEIDAPSAEEALAAANSLSAK